MASGQTQYADITTLTNTIRSGAFFSLRQENLLVPTTNVIRDTSGMNPRNVSTYGDANVRLVGEGDDVIATKLDRTSTQTLTPAVYADQFFITDQRIKTDDQSILPDASMILGGAFAQSVDETIATHFGSVSGGGVGAAGSALTWAIIMEARALMQNLKIPGPYFCALHPFGWLDLVKAALTSGSIIMNSDKFLEKTVQSYFTSTIVGGVTFVITPSIAVDGSDDAVGCMYSKMAFAYDERQAFKIENQRDASRQGWELNASLWYASGVWDARKGVTVTHDATSP